jgi:TPR repeat protein
MMAPLRALALAVALGAAPALAQTTAPTFTPPGQTTAPTFTRPMPTAPALPVPSQGLRPGDSDTEPPPDYAFAAFQRGYFVTALREAMKRIKANPEDAPAMTLIAELYRLGLGVRLDLTEAAHWYKLAADRGDPQAAFALGRAYIEGAGVEKDMDKAKAMFEQAAAKNHPGALYNLGIMAMDATVADFPGAAKLFQRAVDGGDMDAAFALAMLYREGTGVPEDRQKAAQLLKQAADENNVAAEVEYAIALFNGDGVEKNETAAGKYFYKAAARENPIAENRLARMLATGRGVRRDIVEAMKWHILARAAGQRDEFLESQLATLTPQQRVAVDEAVRKFVGNP